MISIKKYNHKLQYEWDEFITNSEGGTIFHYQKFLNYHINKSFQDCSLLFYEKEILIGVLPAALIKNNILMSHPGASFGGFVISGLNDDRILDVLNSFDGFCQENKISSFLLTLSPNNYFKKYNESLERILLMKKFFIKEKYISHVINLKKNNSAILYLNKRKQRYIKNIFLSNPNYKIKTKGNIKKFYSVLLDSKRKFKTTPTHSYGEMIKLLELFPNSIKVFFTYFNDCFVGGTVLFKTSRNSALLFYNIVMDKHKYKHVSTYQIYHCIEWCLNHQVSTFDLGVSHLPKNKDPLDPNVSLIKFKEQFGASVDVRKTYNKKYLST